MVVASAFISSFTVFGIAYSFGAFFDSMADDFGTGKGATALMFSITSAWYFGIGLITGRATDRFGPRVVLVVGAVFLGVGLLATSQVGSIWLGYVTYGLGAGTAVACAYVPMVATVSGWFVRRRTTAIGIAVAGIGIGTLTVAPLSEVLIDANGWRRAYVVLGLAGTAALLVASVLARRPPAPTDAAPVQLRRLARDRSFVVLYVATVLVSLALFVPFVFVKTYAIDEGVDAGPAAALVGVIGASSVLGRLGLGALGGRFGPAKLLQLSFALMATSFVLWLIAGDSLALLIAFTTVMGLAYGGFIALAPAVAASLFGTAGLGGLLGALYTAAGVGGLFGPPLAGELIDRTSYATAIVAAMVVTASASLVLFALPAAGAT
jgi:predicted MFS family arabinose efflux permease